jgi:hypothetical protein
MSKIKKISQRLKNCYYDSIAFGFYIGITNFFWPIIPKMPPFLRNQIIQKKQNKVLNYLYTKYYTVLEKYKYEQNNISSNTFFDAKSPIWVCWLQGEENMPDIPMKCLLNIRKNSNEHKVILISLYNYTEYVKLPEYIVQKYLNGEISNANFSDVLRTVLLAEVGGVWIDSTILMVRPINENVFSTQFYSIKFQNSDLYITKNLWSNFFLAAQKDSLIFKYTRDMLYEYIKDEKRFIDYFLMDYIIRLGYENITSIKQIIDNVPINNPKTHILLPNLLDKYDKNYIERMTNDTYLFKLSWRLKIKANSISNLDYLTKI